MTSPSTRPPLAGVTVVDFSELLPGPFFTQALAEMGARVIKIERPPHGDNARRLGAGGFAAVNRGKESLLVDMKDEAQHAQVRQLVASADVVVESYRPGVMARLGMDFVSLQADCPRLIYVSLSGYGQAGPWSHLPGHDINYLAAAGVLAVSGEAGGPPALGAGLPVADLCGAMYALSSTLAALFQRESTGQGQHLDVALADCALHWMNPRLGTYRESGAVTLQAQREAALVKPAYGAFACLDGRHLSIAALEDHFWQRLCEAIDMAPFDGEAYRSFKQRKPHAQAINQRIADAVKDLDADALFELLSGHDVPVAPVVEPARLAALPQFAARDKFDGGDPMPLVRFPVPLAGMSEGVLGPVPALGSARV